EVVAAQRDRAVAQRQLRLRQLHVTSLAADPEGMLADGEDRVGRILRAAGDDADRARLAAGRRRGGRGRGRVLVDAIRAEVDFLDLAWIEQPRQERRLASRQ